MSVEEELSVDEDSDELRGVVEKEERLRELREEKMRQQSNIEEEHDSEDVQTTIQRGVVRDVQETSGYRDTLELSVEVDSGIIEISLNMPEDEYTLDNHVVMLLELKGIQDGRFSELLGERVYVDTDDEKLVLPSSLSPISRATNQLLCRTNKFVPEGERYLVLALVSTLMHFGFLPIFVMVSESLGGVGLVLSIAFMLVWSFVVGPIFLNAISGPIETAYRKVKAAWKRRYHEV